jgi:hypothetical protein
VLRIYAANFVRVGALVEKCIGCMMNRLHPERIADQEIREAFNDLHKTISADHLELDLPVTAEIAHHHIGFVDLAKNVSYGSIATHPGNEGHVATKIPSSSCSSKTRYFITQHAIRAPCPKVAILKIRTARSRAGRGPGSDRGSPPTRGSKNSPE